MMPFVPEEGRALDSTLTYGEFVRKMTAAVKRAETAESRADKLNTKATEAEARAADAESRLATMPDAAKAAKRADKAEERATEWEGKYNAYVAEATTEKALLTAGITDADDMALVRYKYEQSGAEDFAKYLDGAAREDKHLAPMFAAPDGVEPPPPPENGDTPPARPPTPPTNGGVRPPPAPGKTRDLRWLSTQPAEWKNDPKNWPEINRINGIPENTGVRNS